MELNFLSILVVAAIVIFLFWLFNSIYVIKEWERGVVLRLGRMLPEAKGRRRPRSACPPSTSTCTGPPSAGLGRWPAW